MSCQFGVKFSSGPYCTIYVYKIKPRAMLSYFTNYAVYLACMCLPSEPKITGFQSKHNIISIFRNFFIYIHKTTSLHMAVLYSQIFIYTYLYLIDLGPIPYWY